MVEQTDERSIYEKAVQDRSFIKFILGAVVRYKQYIKHHYCPLKMDKVKN